MALCAWIDSWLGIHVWFQRYWTWVLMNSDIWFQYILLVMKSYMNQYYEIIYEFILLIIIYEFILWIPSCILLHKHEFTGKCYISWSRNLKGNSNTCFLGLFLPLNIPPPHPPHPELRKVSLQVYVNFFWIFWNKKHLSSPTFSSAQICNL